VFQIKAPESGRAELLRREQVLELGAALFESEAALALQSLLAREVLNVLLLEPALGVSDSQSDLVSSGFPANVLD